MIGLNQKFPASLAYTHSQGRALLHNVLGFAVTRANNADDVQPNLLVMPNYDEPEFPLQVVGAFLVLFSNWKTTLLWGLKSSLSPSLQNSAHRVVQAGAQLVVAKAVEVSRAHLLIAGMSGASTGNLTQQQQLQQGMEWEVKRLQVVQSTKDEAQWLDPDTQKLNTTGSDQLQAIRKSMKGLSKPRAHLQDLEKGRKSTPPKGDRNSPPPPTTGAKRKTPAEVPALKKRKTGLPKPPASTDPEDEVDVAKPIAERPRNRPKLSPSKPPPSRMGKGKGKGKGKGNGHGEKPMAAGALDKEPTDDQTNSSSEQEKSGDDEATPEDAAYSTGNLDEAPEDDEIQEE